MPLHSVNKKAKKKFRGQGKYLLRRNSIHFFEINILPFLLQLLLVLGKILHVNPAFFFPLAVGSFLALHKIVGSLVEGVVGTKKHKPPDRAEEENQNNRDNNKLLHTLIDFSAPFAPLRETVLAILVPLFCGSRKGRKGVSGINRDYVQNTPSGKTRPRGRR